MNTNTRIGAGTAAFALLAALCACTTQPVTDGAAPSTPPSTTTSAPQTAPADTTTSDVPAADDETPTCESAAMEGEVGPFDGLGQGIVGAEVVVTNTADEPCLLYGFSELEFYTDDNQPLGIEQTDIPTSYDENLYVQPGESASLTIEIPTDTNTTETCHEQAAHLSLSMPGGDSVDAWPTSGELPAACGPVRVSVWSGV